MMPNHLAAGIANKFIELGFAASKNFTQMQLQKLVYIAHGWNLAISGGSLVNRSPMAWEYGPVFPDLWEALRKYGREGVTDKIKIGDFGTGVFSDEADQYVQAALTQEERDLLEKTYELYGNFHAYQLSAITHENGTPWDRTYNVDDNKKGAIENHIIREHFVGLARRRAEAADYKS